MIGLLILALVVALLVWLAATYLPAPINWIVALVVIVIAVAAIFGGSTSCC